MTQSKTNREWTPGVWRTERAVQEILRRDVGTPGIEYLTSFV